MKAAPVRARITARVSGEVAETLSEAADLAGTSVSNFVIQAALKAAHRIIDRERTIPLSRNDAVMLLDLLDNPPPANAALINAFERFTREKCGSKDKNARQGT